jgi:aryl-alcohol dehydrogenase-like predicted oxidoreductase
MTPFSVYQGRWSASEREFERDIIPMCRHLGLALAPWGALGGGRYKTEEEIAARAARNEKGRVPFYPPTAADRAVTTVLDKISKTRGPDVGVTGIALAYVMHKAPDVFPIVGGRKISQLKENIAALTVRLSDEEINEIEVAGGDFSIGFPHNMLGGGKNEVSSPGEVVPIRPSGNFDFHPKKAPVLPKP